MQITSPLYTITNVCHLVKAFYGRVIHGPKPQQPIIYNFPSDYRTICIRRKILSVIKIPIDLHAHKQIYEVKWNQRK